jgi:3-methyladenine DNA glycosylase AlkD
VATHLVAWVLRAAPADVAPVMRTWASDDDMWVRRTAALCQVGAKDQLDLDLLADCLEPNLDRPEFWLRKACGWALRDVAPRHPDWVRAFLAANTGRVSGLTLREATRRLPTGT